jgi:hypothetical protein
MGRYGLAIAGYVRDSPIIIKHGKRVCDFNEAVPCPRGTPGGSIANSSIPSMARLGAMPESHPGVVRSVDLSLTSLRKRLILRAFASTDAPDAHAASTPTLTR